MTTGLLLEGVRVLDFGRYIAGPYCAALLAEHGAQVIRVEKREGSEDRYMAPISASQEGALFMQMNRNKQSITLDPMHPRGREVVRRLVGTADVVVANLPPRGLAAMGLDYPSLSAIKPDIILTTSSAFGPVGPMADNVGFDGVGQVMSGTVYMTGEPGQPYRSQASWVDFGTALHAAYGTLLALMERQRSGRGQQVTGSLLGTALTVANSLLIEQAVIQADRVPTGNRGQTAGPMDLFRTADGWLLCQVVGQPLFERWARLVGEPGWIDDPRFASDEARGIHGEVLSERMSRWCATRGTDQAVSELGAARIPCGPVLRPRQTLEHPQVAALGVLQPVDYPGLSAPAPVARAPVTLSVSGGGIRQRAPMLGEHTDSVLASIGYGADEIASLRADGAI